MKLTCERRALSSALVSVVLILMLSFTAITYLFFFLGEQGSTIQSQQLQIKSLQTQLDTLNSGRSSAGSSFVVNQAPVTRNFVLTWTKDLSEQDRFFQGPIVVNQGDTVHVTFISNDTAGHTFTIGPPYNFQINTSVVGGFNDLTRATFTAPAINNSPGVVVTGTPGNVSGTGSFVAKYVGIYEYICVYHVDVGMYGYLIVQPNKAYTGNETVTTTATSVDLSHASNVTILPGAAGHTNLGYSPTKISVVIGVNNTVVWTNKDSGFHTVTASDGSFNSGNLNTQQVFSYAFTKPGTYTYYCVYHPWMKGTVIVKGG